MHKPILRDTSFKKSITCMLMIMLMLSLILVQAPAVMAKSYQTSIAEPANDTVVLNVKIGGLSLPYTWGDISGAVGYKFAGQTTSGSYLLAEENCVGIKMTDLLANIESTLSLTLADTDNVKAVAIDGYVNSDNNTFSVAEAKDYDSNHYILANTVEGASEACIGYSSSTTYPATYLRIARNRGETDGFGNSAYMRLISSIQISKSDGSAIELGDINLSQHNGVGLDTITPDPAGLVIGGAGISNGAGLQGSFFYLSQAQVDYIKANKSVDGLGIGSSWTSTPTLYSSYHNHGTPEYAYRLAEGINLKTALTALGLDVSSAPLSLEATSSDGYKAPVSDAFGYIKSRNYIAPDQTVGAAVDPILVFYDSTIDTLTPDSSTEVPTSTEAISDPNPLFAFGQQEVTEQNNCKFVQNTIKIRAGSDTPAFTITQGSTTNTISLSDIALMGIYQTSYFWNNNGSTVTQSLKGVPLNALLSKLGVAVPSSQGLIINVNNGSEVLASSRIISSSEISKCLVAFDAFEDSQRISGCNTGLRLYCPGETQDRVLIENVVGASVSELNQGTDYLAGFEAITEKTATDLNKTWTIKFNQAVDNSTIDQNIFVTDANNVAIETNLGVSDDLKSITVTPKDNYTRNQEYRLYISNQLQAQDSKRNLNKSQVMPFTIL